MYTNMTQAQEHAYRRSEPQQCKPLRSQQVLFSVIDISWLMGGLCASVPPEARVSDSHVDL